MSLFNAIESAKARTSKYSSHKVCGVLGPCGSSISYAEILLSQGKTIAVISKAIGVSSNTYYRWRKEYGGLRVDQARKLKNLEKENVRLKKLVADLPLDNAILKEAAEGNF